MITEETTVGSYVMLDEYELRRSKRLNGNGEVACVLPDRSRVAFV